MDKNILKYMNECGQSPWIDNITRHMIMSGKLDNFISSGITGLTSNPTIFEKAIISDDSYNADILANIKKSMVPAKIYEAVVFEDIKNAADKFLTIYKKTNGYDGYVSVEVSPDIAYDVSATLKAAKEVCEKVNRPNVMIKVPATPEGINAIVELIGDGINVNATLIFSKRQYVDAANAYIKGLQKLKKNKGDVAGVFSVASVFVSRIDATIDEKLNELIKQNPKQNNAAKALIGNIAVANSKAIYQEFKNIFFTDNFSDLTNKGAKIQKVLWASTSTKNPEYSDIKYVSELIGANTINTLPEVTVQAFIDHGTVMPTLEQDFFLYQRYLKSLDDLGISIDKVCNDLQKNGVEAFVESYRKATTAIQKKSSVLIK